MAKKKFKIEDFDAAMDGIIQRYSRQNGGHPGVSPRPKLLQALRMRKGQFRPPPGGLQQFVPPQMGIPPPGGQAGNIGVQRKPIPFFPTLEKPTGGQK